MLPENQKESYHFTYNIIDKSIDLSEELSIAYSGMPRHFSHIPHSFAAIYVHPEDIPQYNEIHAQIDRGEPFATADFRINPPASRAQVCLYRPDTTCKTASGIVQNASFQREQLIPAYEQGKKEDQQRMLANALFLPKKQ